LDYISQIILGNALNVLPKLPAESVSCVTTSPPYWGLRDYGIESVIWDGYRNCKHEFNEYNSKLLHENRQNLDGGTLGNPQYIKNLHGFGSAKAGFCSKCGAWRGNLGLEPTFELYIKHLCDIFDEVKRVLRKDGTCFVNIGDSYNGSKVGNTNASTGAIGKPKYSGDFTKTFKKENQNSIPTKSLCDIPYRFSIEMTNRGWIKRNTIIWWKPNCMPSSAPDRFTIDFEYMFFFTKNNKAIFWTNEKTLECVDKKPLGIKGIEGKDWEWRSCPACSNKGYFNYRTRDIIKKEKDCPQFKASKEEKENIKNNICPRCKGLKKVKYSFWSGHDYWFEQQFESIKEESKKRYAYGFNDTAKRQELRATGSANHKLTKTPSYNGRNRRCVWIIPTQPFPEAHFAVYPEGLIEIPIKAGCPEFVCKKCGKARVRIYEYKGGTIGKSWHDHSKDLEEGMHQSLGGLDKQGDEPYQRVDVGYSDCGCNAGFESGIVLDPFMGAGTTALVALKQRKRFIGIEIKQEYIDMAKRRIVKVQRNLF